MLAFPRFLLKRSLNCSAAFKRATCCHTWKLKDCQTGSHLGRDDPKRCNQIKIILFIQTSLAQSESASPKATSLYVYTRSLFLVACLPSRWQRASRARCLQTKAGGLITPRSSKPLFPGTLNSIANGSICQHMSTYFSMRQHTSAYVTESGWCCSPSTPCQSSSSAYVSVCQRMSAYVSIRQHTSAYVRDRIMLLTLYALPVYVLPHIS
jgi:hypothetical protein